jgi:hypothetical protein
MAGRGASVALEELYFTFVLFRFWPCLKGAEIAAFAGLGILLSRI